MFPLVLLLLVQGLSAVEFPDLAKGINMNWNNADISYSINGDKTVSVKDQVPTFTLCGEFGAQRKDVSCKIVYDWQRKVDGNWDIKQGK